MPSKPALKTERRRDDRLDAIVPVYFRDADEFLVQYTENVSRGGLFIQTDDLRPKDSEIRLSIELPESRTAIPCAAKVAFVGRSERDNRKGMGVRFTRMDPAARRVIDSFVELLDLRSRGYVLVVDDEPDVVDVVTDLLRRNRFNVLNAISVEEALSVIAHNRVDVVLSDVHMPGQSGLHLRQILLDSDDTSMIPFIILSGWEEAENKRLAKELQVTSFLHKPVETKRLVEVLSQALISLELQEEDRDPRARHLRRVARTISDHLDRLGIPYQVDESGCLVTTTVGLDRIQILHPETKARVATAQMRNVGGHSLTFVMPSFLECLSPIRIDTCRNLSAFEDAVEMAYAHRMEWIKLGKDTLQKLRIPHRVYAGGFCVLGDHFVGDDHFFLTVRDAVTVVVESLNGRPVAPVVGPIHSIIDLTFADSHEDVDRQLKALVDRFGDEVKEKAPPTTNLRPNPPAHAGADPAVFAQLDQAFGEGPQVDVRGLWVVDPKDVTSDRSE